MNTILKILFIFLLSEGKHCPACVPVPISCQEREQQFINAAIAEREYLYRLIHKRIENHEDLTSRSDRFGEYPLYLCARSDANIALTQKLLNSNADCNVRGGPFNGTALDRATTYSSLKNVEILLKNGASPNIQDSKGSTPLHSVTNPYTTMNFVQLQIMKMLVQNNANTHIQSHSGGTALLNLISIFPNYLDFLPDSYPREKFLFHRKRLIKLLLWSGNNIFAKNCDGKTAIQIARESKKPELVELADFTETEQRKLRPNLMRLLTHTGAKGQSPFARVPAHVVIMPKNANGTNITLPKEIVEMIVDWVYPFYKS